MSVLSILFPHRAPQYLIYNTEMLARLVLRGGQKQQTQTVSAGVNGYLFPARVPLPNCEPFNCKLMPNVNYWCFNLKIWNMSL